MYVVLLIFGVLLVASAILTPVISFIKDRMRGKKRKLRGYLIAALICAIIGIVLIAVSAPHVFGQ